MLARRRRTRTVNWRRTYSMGNPTQPWTMAQTNPWTRPLVTAAPVQFETAAASPASPPQAHKQCTDGDIAVC